MTTQIKPCPAKFQDAYHYALAAAGDGDSVFYTEKGKRGGSRSGGYTRTECLRMAVLAMREMGFELAFCSSLAGAANLVGFIRGQAVKHGINAYQGIRACKQCGSCEHSSDDHAWAVRNERSAEARASS